MRDAGISREQLADLLDVSIDAVNNWLSNRTKISIPRLEQIVSLLLTRGVDPEWVVALLGEHLHMHGLGEGSFSMFKSFRRRDWIFLMPPNVSAEYRIAALGASNVLDDRGLGNLWTTTFDETQSAAFRSLLQGDISGILICGMSRGKKELNEIRQILDVLHTPCVFLFDGPDPLPKGTTSVGYDRAGCAHRAFQLLVERGHRKIALLGMSEFQPHREFATGFRWGLRELGLENAGEVFFSEHIVSSSPRTQLFEESHSFAKATAVVQGHFTAVIACAPSTAIYLLRALRSQKKTYPADLAIIVLGSEEWMNSAVYPPITHLAPPYYEMGVRAMEILLQLAAGRKAEVVPRSLFDSSHWPWANLDGGSV